MGGTTGRRVTFIKSNAKGDQFRILFNQPMRHSSPATDSSIAWASCSRFVNKPNTPKFVQVTTRNTTYGVMTIKPAKMFAAKKPCGEDKTFFAKPQSGAQFGNPNLPINRL